MAAAGMVLFHSSYQLAEESLQSLQNKKFFVISASDLPKW
jgi:hypothetical protein